MGAIIMNGAVVGDHCIIGAGALVTGGTVIPAGSVVMGRPGRVVKQVTDRHLAMIQDNASRYVELAATYL